MDSCECFLLLGRDFSHDETLDVPTQVELLIKQATSHENLCQCYIGWYVFLLSCLRDCKKGKTDI